MKTIGVKKLLKELINDLEDLKAVNIVTIDIKKRSSIADYLIIVSGNSSRHLNSIATNIQKNYKKRLIATEGIKSSEWLIVDFGDIILNIFRPEARDHYDLQKIWQDNTHPSKQKFG